jgi:hypothetical protein
VSVIVTWVALTTCTVAAPKGTTTPATAKSAAPVTVIVRPSVVAVRPFDESALIAAARPTAASPRSRDLKRLPAANTKSISEDGPDSSSRVSVQASPFTSGPSAAKSIFALA